MPGDDPGELLSHHGSCDSQPSDTALTNTNDSNVCHPVDDESETCSNRSDADQAAYALEVDAHTHLAQAAEAPTPGNGGEILSDIIVPDSQADEATVSVTNKLVVPGLAPDVEGHESWRTCGSSTDPQLIIPDSPLGLPGVAASTPDSGQRVCAPCIPPSCLHSPDSHRIIQTTAQAAVPYLTCEAVPDTEAQMPPLNMSVAPESNDRPTCNPISSSVVSDSERQSAEEQPQTRQQRQQHQHVPPQSVCSRSAGSPGTSYASHALVIEDSDDESDFQPLKPARASTSSCRSAQQPDLLTGHVPVQQGKQGVVPVKLMSRYPRGTTVKEHYCLGSLKGIQFAEQLQVLSSV